MLLHSLTAYWEEQSPGQVSPGREGTGWQPLKVQEPGLLFFWLNDKAVCSRRQLPGQDEWASVFPDASPEG